MKRNSLLVLVLLISGFLAAAAEKRPIGFDDMHAFKAVGSPVLSPDGSMIAYTVGYYSSEQKQQFSDIYLMAADGGQVRRLTSHPAVESGISWSPGGKEIAFSAVREGKKSQIYVISVGGGEAVKLTDLESGASSPSWSPDGKWIAFYSSLGQKYGEAFQKELGDVRFLTHLRYYHNRNWDDGSRQRVFAVPADGSAVPRQLTDGECADEGDHSMTWSPDSRAIAFVSNRDPEWWNSIDTNIFSVTVPEGKIAQLTSNRGPDHSPLYSPDGTRIAWRSIFTYNYESENYKVVAAARDGSGAKTLTAPLDRSVDSFIWSPDGKTIHFLYGSEGVTHIQSVPAAGGPFNPVLTARHVLSGMTLSPDGKIIYCRRGDDLRQMEIHSIRAGSLQKLTAVNDDISDRFIAQPVEEIWFRSPDGARVQGWVIKPVGFQAGKKYPLILSIHGGPHGMSSIAWNYTNQLWAAHGYVVLYTNPRASLGYGEKFSRDIWQDWGGRCYQDVMAGIDQVIKLGFVDPKRMGVTGGSFGGYMTNWIVGHTNRFAAAITVAGLSNLTSFYGTTDEQFFPEAEFKGAPWEQREAYLKHSPIWYAENFRTPTMIIHGEFDFRVRTEQAEQMFTALQKKKVPSVYAWFPDEGHGVRRPDHRMLYNKMMLDWFGHFLKGEPSHYLQMAAGEKK